MTDNRYMAVMFGGDMSNEEAFEVDLFRVKDNDQGLKMVMDAKGEIYYAWLTPTGQLVAYSE